MYSIDFNSVYFAIITILSAISPQGILPVNDAPV